MADIFGVVVSVVIEVGKCLAVPIWRQFKYLHNYTTNFKNLEMEVGKLKNTRDEVERKIIAAERNVQEIKQNVKNWQKDVEKTIIEAEQLIQEKANNPRCFKGLCPNFIIHYEQSKKAFKLKRDGIAPLLQQEKDLDPVSYPTNPPEIWLRSSEDYLAFESRSSTVKNVWDALNNENVYMIGVYGMGGLGKTTLVQELGRKAKEEKLFEEIVFVEVSESPDIKKIQTVIADNLGLKFENESERAKKLYSRMEGKNILLILDNIWEPLEFENTIGIPCGVDRGRNKLLFTSRNLDVLEKMGSTNNFGMGILNENEAWNLFTKMTGNIIQTRELHSLPNDICKECKGLPIVICTIAKALKNKSRPYDWNYALQELRAPSPAKFTRFLEEDYTKIALSYKYLRDDELKKTFLISSLMENNTSISDLFKHVVCLDVFDGVNLTMKGARDRLDKLVCDLKDACLLLDGFQSGQFAMHDVVRVVAMTIAYVDHHVFTPRNDIERDWKNRDKLKKCTKISLPGNSTIISQLWPNDFDCPNLEYFHMTNTRNSSFEIPEDFFTKMPKLRVLILDELQQSSLPSSIDILANLQTLCLDYSEVEDVVVIGRLKKLKVLSLLHSKIKEFPMEMGQLTQLRLLDLGYCYDLEVIASNVLSKLSQLEELYLKGCRIQWKIEVLEQLKLLSSLNSLELAIKDEKVLPKNFFSRELIRYNISVGDWWFRYSLFGEHKHLRMLKLIIDPTINLEELCVIKNVELLCLAEYLDGKDENEDKDDLEPSKFNLQAIEITPLFNKKVIFLDLKVLVLKNIISRKIWDSQLPSSSFQNLKELRLLRYTKIKFVFPYTITKNLHQLQYLEINDCIDLEEIVATEEITEAAVSFVFPQVTFLKLENLPKLATFYPGIHTLEWPKLEKLVMKDCDKFKMFNSEPNSLCLDHKVIFPNLKVLELKSSLGEIWNKEFSTYSYENLTHLTLFECDKIKYVFPLSIAKSLQQLQYLDLRGCNVLEMIVAPEEGTEAAANFFFPQLSTMKLQFLPKFTDFYPRIHISEWQKLKELVVNDCGKFKMFASESNSLCLDQKVHFHDLKVLELKNIHFEKICDSQLSTSSYQNLTHLTLFECDKIKYVFPLSIAKSLQQLQYLELTSCKVLERIVAPEEGREATINFFFPQVSTVKLQYLPEFADFAPGIHTSEWPKLKELVVNNCGKFKMLTSEPNFLCFDQKINHDLEIFQVNDGLEQISWWGHSIGLEISFYESTPIPLWLLQRFENLTCLFVHHCNELVNLTTPSTARSLVQLRELKISNCKMLMEILEIEEDATTEIVFENLNKLSFEQMKNLTCFCSGNYTFNFHSLEELNIEECPNIKTFCRGILSTPKLQKISYEKKKVENEGNDLNKTIQELYKKEKQDISLDLNLKCKTFHHDNSPEIGYNRHPTSFYQNLTHLFLGKCGNIKYAFPSSIAKSLQQLQQLKIQNCKALEEIVAKEDGANAVVNFVFPNITLLKFEDLPELTAFYPGLYALEMPKLKELVVEDCTKYASLKENNVETELNILAPKSIFLDNKINHDLEEFQLRNGWDFISWRSQSKKLKISYKLTHIPLWLLQRFENLACLSVSWCKLVNLTTPLIAKSLVQLRKLKISNCKMLVEILEIEDDATIEIVFENLSKLSFAGIESLLCFSSGNYTFNFPSLEELNITNCPNMMTFCRGILSTPKLQKINYEKMEVENEGNDLNKTIQGLYKKKDQDISLDLNLKCKTFHHDNSLEIGYNRHPTSFYQNLTHLFLWKCENIKYAFPSSIAKSLHQLQQLKIQNCKVLKEIVAKEEGANAVVDFIFPNITLLKVEDLPELTAFYPGIYTLEMPKLKELVVKDCTKYASLKENNMETELNILAPKSIFLDNKINFNLKVFDGETNIGWLSQSKALTIKDISVTISLRLLQRFENVRELQLSSSQYKDIKSLCDLPNLEILEVRYCYRLMSLVPFSGSFQNLKVLKVGSCDRLIMKLITLSVAKSLTQLRELSISYCDMLTEIVDNEGDATSTEIVFNSLNKLSLDSLESLICFCSGNYSFNFPSLEELIIKDCPNLEIFCQGRLCTPNLDRFIYKFKDRVVKLDEAKKVREVEIWDNDLNTTIQQKYKKKVGSSWEELTLSGRNIMTTLQGEFQENFDKVKTLRLIKDDHEYIGIHILEKFINLKKLILIVSLYEEIFSCEEGEEHVGALSKLEELQLQGLFNLKCSWKQDFRFKSILQNLHSLNVKHCHNLMTLLPSSSSFKNLMTLEVEYCSGMQNLMTSSTAKSLVCLKTLSIEGCEMMIEVLASEGDIEKNEVVFERLEELHLYNLESLTWFYYGNYTLKFPFLESLTVAKCSKMKTFSREGVNMPRLQQVNGNNCSDDLNYVTTQLQNNCSKVWEKFPW